VGAGNPGTAIDWPLLALVIVLVILLVALVFTFVFATPWGAFFTAKSHGLSPGLCRHSTCLGTR
jgi:Na+-driven multidrug efflux pump